MSKKQTKVPVSLRAVIQRVQRKLEAKGEMLKGARDGAAMADLGKFYTIDVKRNCIVHRDIDIEQFAREVGALKAWEVVR